MAGEARARHQHKRSIRPKRHSYARPKHAKAPKPSLPGPGQVHLKQHHRKHRRRGREAKHRV